MERYDYAVIGLGALGSATAYSLARRGHRVIGLEQYEYGHVRGSSHDTSRILRRSYHVPVYVRLADSAYRDWHDLEAVAGERLVTTTGGVTFCPAGSTVRVEDYAAAMDAHDVAFEVLDAASLAARWPQFRVAPDVRGVVQEDSAIVHASRTTAVLQLLARAAGAVLRAECPVHALDPGPRGVQLDTAAGLIEVGTVVVCADAWTNKLLAPLGAALPLVSTLEQVSYFAPAVPAHFAPDRFPVWIWAEEPCYYGFPTYGEPSIKAARDNSGVRLDVDERRFEPVQQRHDELAGFLAGLLPGSGAHLRTVTCQYTLTPDRDFVLGAVPGLPDVLVGLGAGHAFKFAPTIGRVLADLASTGATDEDVDAFAAERFRAGRTGSSVPHSRVAEFDAAFPAL